MQPDPLAAAFDGLLGAVENGQAATGELIAIVRDQAERLLELSENVATLGVRVSTLEVGMPAGHSLRVLEPVSTAHFERVTAELRAELATEVTALTERIDHVHRKALTALTALTERNQPA